MRHEFSWKKDNFRNMFLNPGWKPYCMALVATLVFAGCGGHNTPPTPPGPPPVHFLYGRNGATVYGFGEDKTGALTPLPGSPFTATPMANQPLDAAGLISDPQGKFLFIPGELTSIISPDFYVTGYSINSTTGAVASSATGIVHGRNRAFHPSGKFLYIATLGILTIPSSFQGIAGVDLSTANFATVPGSPFPIGQYMTWLSVDPAGHFLYATAFLNPGLPPTNQAFEIYSVDSTTGALTLISTDASPGVQPSGSIIFHPSGKFAYALNTRSGNPVLDLYSVNTTTGALTFVSTQVNATFFVESVLMHPSGNFLYGCLITVGQPCQPVGYRVDNNTGALTPIPGFSLGPAAGITLVMDKSGQFAYALSPGNPPNQIFVYSIDPSTGLMAQLPNLTTTVSAGVTEIVAGR